MKKIAKIIQSFRKVKYTRLSTCKNVVGSPNLFQPMQCNGAGNIFFGDNIQIGVVNSPFFYNTYAYIEARKATGNIHIGNNVAINNNFCAVVNESQITIGDDVIIGVNCQIYDCNFHNLDPLMRHENGKSKPVIIEQNVFVGSNVIILSGVTIGENSVIGAGSVVSKDVPPNTVYHPNSMNKEG